MPIPTRDAYTYNPDIIFVSLVSGYQGLHLFFFLSSKVCLVITQERGFLKKKVSFCVCVQSGLS